MQRLEEYTRSEFINAPCRCKEHPHKYVAMIIATENVFMKECCSCKQVYFSTIRMVLPEKGINYYCFKCALDNNVPIPFEDYCVECSLLQNRVVIVRHWFNLKDTSHVTPTKRAT